MPVFFAQGPWTFPTTFTPTTKSRCKQNPAFPPHTDADPSLSQQQEVPQPTDPQNRQDGVSVPLAAQDSRGTDSVPTTPSAATAVTSTAADVFASAAATTVGDDYDDPTELVKEIISGVLDKVVSTAVPPR